VIVVPVKINGHTIRALLDSGSMADFISTTVADQLKLPKEVYQRPLSVQLAVHGSRSKINCGTTVRLQYQTIDCDRTFDIANLDNYDAILGTPFLFQHQIAITGCIEGFFEAENCKENAVESINTISLFCTLKKCN